jgi:predicted membrane channel-forming protein YqfA (hemolysin III family)
MKLSKQSASTKVLTIITWLFFRLLVLNAIILALTLLLTLSRNLIEGTEFLVIKLPLELYLSTFFLGNLVYVIGNLFEIIYMRLWNIKIEVRKFEKKFFKGAIVMIVFAHLIGVIMYFIYYFE